MRQKTINTILQQTKEIYNAIAPDFDLTRGKWWALSEALKTTLPDGSRVLDLGCGNGRLAEFFDKTKITYLGLDNSQELINIAQEKFQDRSNIKFAVADITNLDLAGQKFDLVYLLAVLHHVPTRELRLKILRAISQVLPSGGSLIVATWHIAGIKKYRRYFFDYKYKISQGVWGLFDAFIPWKKLGDNKRRYVHDFTAWEMAGLLRQSGFEVEDIYYESQGERVNFWRGFNLVARARKK